MVKLSRPPTGFSVVKILVYWRRPSLCAASSARPRSMVNYGGLVPWVFVKIEDLYRCWVDLPGFRRLPLRDPASLYTP